MIVDRADAQTSAVHLERPASAGLAEVVEIILDKGLVIDAYVRVSLVGIELLTIDARVVIASVDTYLRFAEAANRLDLRRDSQAMRLSAMISTSGGDDDDSMGENVGEGIVDRAINRMTSDKDDHEEGKKKND